MGRLEPAAGEFPLMQTRRDVALAFTRGLHTRVRADVLEDDDPIGVVLIDRGIKKKHARARDGQVLGQRLAQIARMRLVWLAGICAKASAAW